MRNGKSCRTKVRRYRKRTATTQSAIPNRCTVARSPAAVGRFAGASGRAGAFGEMPGAAPRAHVGAKVFRSVGGFDLMRGGGESFAFGRVFAFAADGTFCVVVHCVGDHLLFEGRIANGRECAVRAAAAKKNCGAQKRQSQKRREVLRRAKGFRLRMTILVGSSACRLSNQRQMQ